MINLIKNLILLVALVFITNVAFGKQGYEVIPDEARAITEQILDLTNEKEDLKIAYEAQVAELDSQIAELESERDAIIKDAKEAKEEEESES